MAVHDLGVYGSGGRMRPVDAGAVYFIVAQVNNNDLVIKIGRSALPIARYATLLPGIPYLSMMYFFWAGSAKRAVRFERHMHTFFKKRNTAREWFRFQEHELEDELIKVATECVHVLGFAPQWKTLTEKAVADYLAAAQAAKPKPQRRYETNRRTPV